jgi:hypothetical protein
MRDGRRRTRLPHEASASDAIGRQARREHLHGHETLEGRLPGKEHGTHTTLTEELEHLVLGGEALRKLAAQEIEVLRRRPIDVLGGLGLFSASV